MKLLSCSLCLFLFGITIILGCKEQKKNKPIINEPEQILMGLEKNEFGKTDDGKTVHRYILKNGQGIEIGIITYGGIITHLKVPNRLGVAQDIVLGYDALDQYLEASPYFGAIIGRYGNRIAKAQFTLNDVVYTLAQNNGNNHIHGGKKGFDKVVWKATEETGKDFIALKLSYLSKDMEEGYPGNLNVLVTYTLTTDNTLKITYEATTDKTTVVNLTQHSYFNLSGDFSKTVLDHHLRLNADRYLPVDEELIPTGELAYVKETPFDFTTPKPIGRDIERDHQQLKIGMGFDHCWVLNGSNKGQRLAAKVYHPKSGRLMEVFTTEPGIQFYSGNFLDGTLPSKDGGTYKQRSGFCLETQHFPDSPNRPEFPSVILHSGETYHTETAFHFSIKD